jgi:hypothetical protein
MPQADADEGVLDEYGRLVGGDPNIIYGRDADGNLVVKTHDASSLYQGFPEPDRSGGPGTIGPPAEYWGNPDDPPNPDMSDLYNDVAWEDVFTNDGVVIKWEYMDWYILEVMNEEDPMLMAQSSPYVYIADGKNEYYNALVAMGPKALPELEQETLEAMGLSAYLLATAIEKIAQADILGIIDDPYGVSSAGGFMVVWTEAKESVGARIREFAFADDLSTTGKMEKIKNYGLLAIPALEELASDSALSSDLREQIQNYLDEKRPVGEDYDALLAYVG